MLVAYQGPLASLVLFFGLLAIDQISKQVATGWFEQAVLCNASGPWGLPLPLPLLLVAPLGILTWMIGIQWKEEKPDMALLLILAGGTGNLVDRMVHGCVIDFISLAPLPLLNIADIFLSFGCALLLLAAFRNRAFYMLS